MTQYLILEYLYFNISFFIIIKIRAIWKKITLFEFTHNILTTKLKTSWKCLHNSQTRVALGSLIYLSFFYSEFVYFVKIV